jgi:hypothetical protein
VHPDVIAIDRTFYPFCYVMVAEPYPYGDASRENPSLLCSDDGLRWEVPAGVQNPVVAAPEERGGWNSDGDVVNLRNEMLAIYFRYNSGWGETTLLRTVSADGVHWTEPTPLLGVAVSGRFASPAVVDWHGRLHLFYVDTIDGWIGALSSIDGVRWSDERRLFHFPAAWHLDGTVDEGYVYLLLNDGKSLFLVRSADLESWVVFRPHGMDRGDGWTSLGARAPEGDHHPPLLGPAREGWDDRRIYRGSCLFEGRILRLWYSAESTRGEWRVGYTDGYVPA